jgi:hypothetical protein
MSFGPLFMLRTRGRQAKPESANEVWPALTGWFERRSQRSAAGSAGTPQRRAADKPGREREPK